jgi:hypothetical protein
MASLVDWPAWRWVERFLHEHLGTLEDAGHLAADEAEAFRDAWAGTRAVPGALLVTPAQLTVVARRAG